MSGSKKKGREKFYLLIIVLLVIVLAAGAGVMRIGKSITGPLDASSEETVQVEIPVGSSSAKIGKILEKDGIIASAASFKIVTRLSREADYKAGTYELSPSMTMKEIREVLLKGKDSSSTSMVVIPEGYTLADIAAALEKAEICSANDFLWEAGNGQFEYDFLQGAVEGDKRLEGFLFPDSYDFYKGENPHNVIEKMLARFDQVYKEILEQSPDSSVLSQYNASQITAAASLIEREAFLDKDRALIASVIYNRLNAGMKLQFNTTVEYILGEIRELTYDDLAIDSPYNTYLYAGLPAGPIASPGRASLEAAVNPAETGYYYFVTSDKGDSSMAFSETYEQFLVDKDKWKVSLKDQQQ